MTSTKTEAHPAGGGPAFSEQLGVFFPESVVRNAVLSASEETKVRQRECPKCGDWVSPHSDHGSLDFLLCIGCGCMFVMPTEPQAAKKRWWVSPCDEGKCPGPASSECCHRPHPDAWMDEADA